MYFRTMRRGIAHKRLRFARMTLNDQLYSHARQCSLTRARADHYND